MKELPNVRVEQKEQKACDHKTLTHIGTQTSWYQCKKCKHIFNILNAAVYRDKKAIKDEFEGVIKDAK